MKAGPVARAGRISLFIVFPDFDPTTAVFESAMGCA